MSFSKFLLNFFIFYLFFFIISQVRGVPKILNDFYNMWLVFLRNMSVFPLITAVISRIVCVCLIFFLLYLSAEGIVDPN